MFRTSQIFFVLVLVITVVGSLTPSAKVHAEILAESEVEKPNESSNQSASNTERNLIKITQLTKEHGRSHSMTTKRYIEALGPMLSTKKPELLNALNHANHPMYKLANDAVGSAYYDRLFAYERLAAIDADGPWKEYAAEHAKIWLAYIEASGGTLAGRWCFGEGLSLHYQRTKDERTLKALEKLVNKAHYARDNFPDESTWAFSKSPIRSREVAYGLKTQIAWERLQNSKNKYNRRSPRIDKLADFALGHIDQWFSPDTTWIVPHENGESLGSDIRYARPFMVALTVRALLNYAEAYSSFKDPAVNNRIKSIDEKTVLALSSIWKSSWNKSELAFAYTDRELPKTNRDYDELGTTPQPDLNLLLAPVFFAVGQRNPKAMVNGDISFIEASDYILEGAVLGVGEWSWGQNKQYNQQLFHDTVGYVQERQKLTSSR